MTTESPWKQAAERIDHTALATYLASHGWTVRGKRVRGIEAWGTGRAGSKDAASLLLPIDFSLPDYRPLVERALRAIGDHEDRPVGDVIVDVASPSSSIFRVGVDVEGEPQPGVPIRVGLTLFATLRGAIEAAAEEVAETLYLTKASRILAVGSYLDRVRLEHTATGSYVMRAVLPDRVGLQPAGGIAEASVAAQLAEDVVTLGAIAEGSVQLSRNSRDWNFAQRVAPEVGRLHEQQVMAVTMEVSRPRDPERESTFVRFEEDAMAQLREFSHRFELEGGRRVAASRTQELGHPVIPEFLRDYEIRGLVVRLARPSITVKTAVQGHIRQVTLPDLPPHLYEIALEAHRLQAPIVARGVLVLRANRARLDAATLALVTD